MQDSSRKNQFTNKDTLIESFLLRSPVYDLIPPSPTSYPKLFHYNLDPNRHSNHKFLPSFLSNIKPLLIGCDMGLPVQELIIFSKQYDSTEGQLNEDDAMLISQEWKLLAYFMINFYVSKLSLDQNYFYVYRTSQYIFEMLKEKYRMNRFTSQLGNYEAQTMKENPYSCKSWQIREKIIDKKIGQKNRSNTRKKQLSQAKNNNNIKVDELQFKIRKNNLNNYRKMIIIGQQAYIPNTFIQLKKTVEMCRIR